MTKEKIDLNKGKPFCYLNEKGEESLAFFHANDNNNYSKIILSKERRSEKEEDWFSVSKHLTYEPNNNFEKENAQFFFNIDTEVRKSNISKDDTHVDTSIFDDVTLDSIKHTYKVLNTPGFARPILGFKKRASKNIVDFAEKFNLKILIDAINFTGIVYFDKGLSEHELKSAEEMAAKIDGFLGKDIQNNTNAKAALVTKNIVDTLGTSAHYAIKLNAILHVSIKAVIENKISKQLNIPKNKIKLEERAVDLTRSLIDKWVSESLKNSNSGLIQEYSRALDNQFKANATNAPLNLLNKENKKFKGLFLFSQVMLIEKLKTLDKTLDQTLECTFDNKFDESKFKELSVTDIRKLNSDKLIKTVKKPNTKSKIKRSNSMI